MRIVHILPVAAAFGLVACGSSKEDDSAASELSADDVADAAAALPDPMPGQYTTKLELVDFDVPGMPEAMKGNARSAVASGFAEGNSFCLTPEDAAQGSKRMLEQLAESDCTFDKFETSGGTVDADMSCKGESGDTNRIKMTGTMTAQSSLMTMEIAQPLPGMGTANIKAKVSSQRTGACS